MGAPERQGLYDPRNEHDACGVGFFHNGRADCFKPFYAGKSRGFNHQFAKQGKLERETALVFAKV